MTVSEEKLAALRDYGKGRPEILLIYLFGSQARKETHARSDVDLAFLLQKSPSLDEHALLVVEVSRLFHSEAVDVVLLNEAPPLLKFDVLLEGKLIYQAISDDELNAFELRIIKEYFDTEPLRQVQNLYLRERLLGTSGGL